VDASAGDYVVVPTRAPHTFSNETGEEARFFNTFTPVSFPFLLAVFAVFVFVFGVRLVRGWGNRSRKEENGVDEIRLFISTTLSCLLRSLRRGRR